MRSWILAAALALAATPLLASAQDTAPAGTMQMSFEAAPAPLPDGATAVAADQSGQSVDVSVGGAIAIQLRRTPSVGTNWSVASKPDFLADPEQLSGPTVRSTRPVLGAPTWQVFVFSVSAAGSGDVTLEKRDRTGAVVETFTVTVNAQ